jgi:hypothetical protein
MQTTRHVLVILTYIFLNINSYAQPCYGIHGSMLCTIPAPDINEFRPSSYSKSVLLNTKVPYKYSVILTPGKDYIIGVCCELPYRPVRFKLIDLQKDTVVYDNSEDNYMESIGFTVEQNPLNLVIEVTVMASDAHPKSGEETRSCMGLRILYRTIGKKGFY